MIKRVLLIGLCVLAAFLWVQRKPDKSLVPSVDRTERVEPEENSATAERRPIASPSQAPTASPQQTALAPTITVKAAVAGKPAEPSEPTFMTKDQFADKFKSRPFAEWMKEAKPFKDPHSESDGSWDIGHEGGVIRVGDQEIEFRYNFTGINGDNINSDSCVSIKELKEEPELGVYGEGTLSIWQLPIEHTFVIGIHNKNFLVRYTDWTESRARDEYNQPRSPLVTLALLYYKRGDDGKITYRGKIEKFSWPDADMKLRGIDFCKYSFPEESRQ